MSRNTLNKLTDRQCKAAKPRDKTYKLSDGGGLYLEVSQTGSKYWRMKYRRPSDKKEDRLAFGVYPTISLQDAREKRDNAKKLLVKGIDPKAEQRAAKAEEKGAFTFETIGRQWVESHQMWNEAHRKRVLRSLEMYIFPHIGTSDIRKLEAMTILPLFKKVDDAGKHDTANRLKQRVKDIIHSARLSGIKTEIITNDLDVRLMQYETKHHAALHPRDLPDFFTRLGSFKGNPLTRLAIELTMLTFVRSSELPQKSLTTY
ncbi:integrase arm-type DNA-binding domain-containing protein [Escherichia coli]|uniref:tyrosine-type recombinase/integrase n=1 Tax=Escherichia coli TaxID=562 RepID=UPI0030CBA961